MNKKLSILLILIGCIGPAAAEIEFSQVDADRDGFITEEESEGVAELRDAFADFDQDKDGKLSGEEFEKYMEVAEPADKGG